VNAASEAAPVLDVPAEYVQHTVGHDGGALHTIKGIVPALRACATEGCLLHETGLASWARSSQTFPINGYHHFPGPAASVRSETARLMTTSDAVPQPST
jgi:hypothetical protein